eukprot:1144030-Pelagomonas_calceolata.AAC.1
MTQSRGFFVAAGDLIRPEIADARERLTYNRLVGAGTYIFRCGHGRGLGWVKRINLVSKEDLKRVKDDQLSSFEPCLMTI